MQYEGSIYRPPSEAYSLIVQVTVGCTHNKCTFCEAFKPKEFRAKPFEVVLSDLQETRRYYRHVERVFFADGDAFCLTTDELMRLLNAVRELFPECTRVGIYARSSQILSRSHDELVRLRNAGLGIVYIGAESGSDKVLRRVEKGESAAQIIESVQKAEGAGIMTSVTFVLGLGGRELMIEHATKTGEMIAVLGASYVGLLTLMLDPAAPLYADAMSGRFEELSPAETLDELEIILEHANCEKETVLRSNHASNWLVLKGVLPHDKDKMLSQIRHAKTNSDMLRPDSFRRL